MPKLPSGNPAPGSVKNDPLTFTGVVTLTASVRVDLRRALRRTRGRVSSTRDFAVISLSFEDAGGAAAEGAQRLSSVKNTDGTFTIYAEKADPASSATSLVWIAGTGTSTVRWTVIALN